MGMLSVRMDETTDTALQSLCLQTGMTKSEVVKAGIIELATKRHKSAQELAQEMGIIGCFESGKGDLAKNAKRYVKDKLREKHPD